MSGRSWQFYLIGILIVLIAAAASLLMLFAGRGSDSPEVPSVVSDDAVSLRKSTITWQTVEHRLNAENGFVPGSLDGSSIVPRTFNIWILENKYLKVTLLPEYGGRILSVVYKPTGHEELYQNPVGLPYQIGSGIFYYDWLMVYGGIFPTFPEPEHSKTWLLPWAFEVVTETEGEVTVAMSIVDEVDFAQAPGRYNLGATGLQVDFYVTLRAGRAALDTRAVISNPGAEPVAYEFWMNTTLAPGSDPNDPRAGAGAEIIAPVEMVKMPPWWPETSAQETPTGLIDVYEFDALRWFRNWPDMGIAYAFPDMQAQNFWGVINHDHEEGFFRIADNEITPGLKIWTWGFPRSSEVDPFNGKDEARPYIELWAGVTREFWQRTTLDAGQQLTSEETYAPSVGLADVTHANQDFLVNLKQDQNRLQCQVFGFHPGKVVRVLLSMGAEHLLEETVVLSPLAAIDCSVPITATDDDAPFELVIVDEDGDTLFRGTANRTIQEK